MVYRGFEVITWSAICPNETKTHMVLLSPGKDIDREAQKLADRDWGRGYYCFEELDDFAIRELIVTGEGGEVI